MNIPRVHFAHLPTRVEELPRLTAYLNGPRLLVKRDDQTGLAFGGNKTRKLEFLLAEALGQGPSEVLVDGNLTPHGRCDGWCWPARAIVGGVGIEPAISAASIVAKEWRDRMMVEAARAHPHYGWERNKGYGSAEHLEALRRHGPSPLHRRSFAPVAQADLFASAAR